MTRLPFSRADLAAVSAVALSLVAIASPASAQSFIQKLFGFGDDAQQAPVATPAANVQIPSYRFQSRPRDRFPTERSEEITERVGPSDSEGPFQTMCVRTCDGFYFPLRYNAKNKHFRLDARACKSACGENAKLFVYSTRGGSPETMRDLAGRRYTDLETAFAFRTNISSACRCQPEPWSAEATARHDEYARIEAEEQAKTEALDRAKDIAIVRRNEVFGPPAPEQKPAETASTEQYQPDVERVEPMKPAVAVAPVALAKSPKQKLAKAPKPAAPTPAAKVTKVSAPAAAPTQPQKSSSGFAGLFGGGGKYVYPGDPVPQQIRRQ